MCRTTRRWIIRGNVLVSCPATSSQNLSLSHLHPSSHSQHNSLYYKPHPDPHPQFSAPPPSDSPTSNHSNSSSSSTSKTPNPPPSHTPSPAPPTTTYTIAQPCLDYICPSTAQPYQHSGSTAHDSRIAPCPVVRTRERRVRV
jgi:hypothetical protein